MFYFKSPKIKIGWFWHQDVLIQVNKKIEDPAYSSWSTKEGVIHVKPPIQILNSIWSFRLHLDDCYKNDGPLKVIPKSHANGYLDIPTLENNFYDNSKIIE